MKEYHVTTLARLALCPGTERMSEGAAKVERAAAAKGTKIHKALAVDSAPDLYDYAEKNLNTNETFLAGRCWGWAAEHTPSSFSSHKEVEIRMALPSGNILTGKMDRVSIALNVKHAVILDFKTGPLPLEEAYCYGQGAGYAYLLCRRYPQLESFLVGFFHAETGDEYWTTILVDEMPAILLRFEEIIRSSEANPVELRPSLAACKYCDGKAQCVAAMEEVSRFPAYQVLGDEKRIALTPAARGQALAKAKLVKDLAEGIVEAFTLLEQMKPGSVAGWKLRTQKKRRIDNVLGAAHMLEKRMSLADVLRHARLSIGALEDEYASLTKKETGSTKKAGEEEFKHLTKGLVAYDETSFLVKDDKTRRLLEE